MTADAGLRELQARLNPPGQGLGLSVDADLSVQIGQLVGEIKLERARRAVFDQKLAQAIRFVPLPAQQQPTGAPATFASPDWVCKTGYSWAVQRVTAKGLGATDVLWVYRTSASGAAEVVDSAALWQLNNANPAWHPGRTGLVLQPGDGIALQGTTTAAVTVSIDVLLLEAWIVPDFLL